MAPPVYQQTVFIAAPALRAWAALIAPSDVAQYHLCPLETIELRPGGRIVYGSGGQPFITGVITEVVPERRLTHTFRFTADTHPNVEQDAESRVTYALVPMGEMCQLTLTHDGFGSDDRTLANVTGGWPTILSGLKTLLETGKPLPWPTGGAR
jgi:uncharacterized protein YndB with AHSA1/START domain